MVTVLLTEKGGETKQLSFEKDEITVGRVQGNDIVLPKGNVSKRHCRVMVQGGKYSVEDLKSTNGTYINGRKIGEVTAVGGTDKIYVGDFVIRIDAPGESASVPANSDAPEAGSLSTALPRRPPPPPAPGRATTMLPAQNPEAGDGKSRSSGRTVPPPPPSPSARRDTSGVDAVNTMPPEPTEMPPLAEPEDEVLSPRPRLQVPPLKSPRPLLSSDDGPRTIDEDVLTGHRDRIAARPTGSLSTGASSGASSWLEGLLQGDGASAVFVSGGRVEVERQGARETVTPPAGTTLEEAIRALAARGTPRPSGDTRVVNVFLPENARLAAIFPPVAGELVATLERTAPAGASLGDLVLAGALSSDTQAVITAALETRRNILVGGDGRAIETLLQAIAGALAPSMRVVSLASVTTPPNSSWIKLARDSHLPDLVRAAASLRPDYLIVDVTAPGLATDVLSQAVLGQEGAIVTIAARSTSDALGRLSALAGPALGGIDHARELAAAAFDLVLCVATVNGSVRVIEVGEPRSSSVGGQPDVKPAVIWRSERGPGGNEGGFEVVGRLDRLSATLTARGVDVPPALSSR